MKKFLISIILACIFSTSVYAAEVDKYSKDYLQNKKHFAIINPIAENVVEAALKHSLKKETGAEFKVNFTGYTTSSIKKGIFKSLELTAENLTIDEIPILYLNLKSLTDYNYIDYTKNPVEYKSDMTFGYKLTLNEDSLNTALKTKKYQKTISQVNNLAYPLFYITEVRTKIIRSRLFLIIDYNFPIAKSSRDKTFITSSDVKIENGNIKATNVRVDTKYGNLGLDRVANLINLLNPLDFTLKLMDSKKCKANIENVNIVDNNIEVDGKIFVESDNKN